MTGFHPNANGCVHFTSMPSCVASSCIVRLANMNDAIEWAQKILAADPANERAHQHLMFCYVATGNRQAALEQYGKCKRALHEELAAEPSSETIALFEWVKQSATEPTQIAARITNLPIPLTSFVGRKREIGQ